VVDEASHVKDQACHGEVVERREDQSSFLLLEHAMHLGQAKGECDCESYYGKDELIVAELLPPDEADPPRQMPILTFVQGPERCDCHSLNPAVDPCEDEGT